MVQINTKIQNIKNQLPYSNRTYNEVVHYLDTNWSKTTSLSAISHLDECFGLISKKLNIAIVSGTTGKSTTIHFACKLLQEEGLKVGAFYTPHITLYNERFSLNNEQISDQAFTLLANQVIQVAQDNKIAANTKDILTMMALIFFKENNVNLAILENAEAYGLDPVMYCSAKIIAITRVVPNNANDDTHAAISNIMNMLTVDSHFVAADQNKLNLQIMHQVAENKGCSWSMPIRKLAPLLYPFEQLHGRCAALAERIAHIFVDNFLYNNLDDDTVIESLLKRPKGLRGRPTLEAKKVSEMNPSRTVEQFWSETKTTLHHHFELIETKKSTLLLDNADTLDALNNLFLGVRLLAYKQDFKEISLIIACHEAQFEDEEFIKQARYFFKKASGSIAFCPTTIVIGEKQLPSWDMQRITNAAQMAKIKATAYNNFAQAFDAIKSAHDDKDCLIVITGSQSIISEYEKYKEVITE